MQLTRASEYAIRGLVFLRDAKGGMGFVRQIATELEMPESFLAKIFSSLTKAGIVLSQRGQHGGYRLAISPGELSLKRIIEAAEGPLALARCQLPIPTCDNQRCGLRKVFAEAQKKMENLFEDVHLSDIEGYSGAHTPEIQ